MNTVLGAVNDILAMSLRPVSVAHDQRPAVAASSMLAAVAAPPNVPKSVFRVITSIRLLT
jgi:hypothetical protein